MNVTSGSFIPDVVYSYACQPSGTNLLPTIIIAFIVGVAFGPLSDGLVWFLIYTIVYWIIDYLIFSQRPGCWSFVGRTAPFLASFLGFIVGRTLFRGFKYQSLLPRGRLPWEKQDKTRHDTDDFD